MLFFFLFASLVNSLIIILYCNLAKQVDYEVIFILLGIQMSIPAILVLATIVELIYLKTKEIK